jgi:hypothetical protein
LSDGYAETVAAFAAGYAAADERQAYYQANPGVPCGFEPDLDANGQPPAGLGYQTPPDPVPVYEADSPGLVPHVLPVPPPVDLSAGPALTGATHGGWAPRDSGMVFASPPRRRSLFNRLRGRG